MSVAKKAIVIEIGIRRRKAKNMKKMVPKLGTAYVELYFRI